MLNWVAVKLTVWLLVVKAVMLRLLSSVRNSRVGESMEIKALSDVQLIKVHRDATTKKEKIFLMLVSFKKLKKRSCLPVAFGQVYHGVAANRPLYLIFEIGSDKFF